MTIAVNAARDRVAKAAVALTKAAARAKEMRGAGATPRLLPDEVQAIEAGIRAALDALPAECARCGAAGDLRSCDHCDDLFCSECYSYPCAADPNSPPSEDEDEGCPVGDHDCTSRDDECHDAFEAPR